LPLISEQTVPLELLDSGHKQVHYYSCSTAVLP
jgi:hypothetical protein